jgi:hypothetical protein
MTNMWKRGTRHGRQVTAIADACSLSDVRVSLTSYGRELLGRAGSPP